MIYDNAGRRKYLTISEREAFIEAAKSMRPEVTTFCLTLAYTGARISEILALTHGQVDRETDVVIVESLKKRRPGIYRAIPIPHHHTQNLISVHKLALNGTAREDRSHRFWNWGRTTAWMLTKQVMRRADIAPQLATPKALRHAFGVGAVQANVPLNLVQRWMGHSRLTTTTIYADVVGEEERSMAMRMWETSARSNSSHPPSRWK